MPEKSDLQKALEAAWDEIEGRSDEQGRDGPEQSVEFHDALIAEVSEKFGRRWLADYRTLVSAGEEYVLSAIEAYRELEGKHAYEGRVRAWFIHTYGEPEGASRYLSWRGQYEALRNHVISERQRELAARQRKKRAPALWQRGLVCVLRDDPDITAEQLRDWIDAERRLVYDNDDIELSLDGDDIVVRDLDTRAESRIKKNSQREYLHRARNS